MVEPYIARVHVPGPRKKPVVLWRMQEPDEHKKPHWRRIVQWISIVISICSTLAFGWPHPYCKQLSGQHSHGRNFQPGEKLSSDRITN